MIHRGNFIHCMQLNTINLMVMSTVEDSNINNSSTTLVLSTCLSVEGICANVRCTVIRTSVHICCQKCATNWERRSETIMFMGRPWCRKKYFRSNIEFAVMFESHGMKCASLVNSVCLWSGKQWHRRHHCIEWLHSLPVVNVGLSNASFSFLFLCVEW